MVLDYEATRAQVEAGYERSSNFSRTDKDNLVELLPIWKAVLAAWAASTDATNKLAFENTRKGVIRYWFAMQYGWSSVPGLVIQMASVAMGALQAIELPKQTVSLPRPSAPQRPRQHKNRRQNPVKRAGKGGRK
jgi:hypothetical protein